MAKLRTAQVFRGGVTASHLKYETDHVTAEVRGRTIEFRFTIASKGGGRTELLMDVGIDGFLPLVKEVATRMPDTAVELTEAGAVASKINLEALRVLRGGQRPPGLQI